jgi:hypothetical protein
MGANKSVVKGWRAISPKERLGIFFDFPKESTRIGKQAQHSNKEGESIQRKG